MTNYNTTQKKRVRAVRRVAVSVGYHKETSDFVKSQANKSYTWVGQEAQNRIRAPFDTPNMPLNAQSGVSSLMNENSAVGWAYRFVQCGLRIRPLAEGRSES